MKHAISSLNRQLSDALYSLQVQDGKIKSETERRDNLQSLVNEYRRAIALLESAEEK